MASKKVSSAGNQQVRSIYSLKNVFKGLGVMFLGLIPGGLIFHLIVNPIIEPYFLTRHYGVIWYPTIGALTWIIPAIPFAFKGEKIIFSKD